jgi:GAF domain-containing protein
MKSAPASRTAAVRKDIPADRLEAIIALADPGATGANLAQRVYVVLHRLHSFIRFDGATLYLYDDNSQSLRELVSTSRKVHFLEYLSFGEGVGLQGWVAAQRQPLLIPARRELDEIDADTRYRSILAVPISNHRSLIGVISLGSVTPGSYTAQTVDLARLLAPMLASFLETQLKEEEIARLREEIAQVQAALGKVNTGPDLVGRLREAAQMAAAVTMK